jgi:putative acetyltransferase
LTECETVVVRDLSPGETRDLLEVHHAAVRGLASADYSTEVIEAWAPLPITDQYVERVLSNPENERRLAAVVGGRIVGIGAVVLARSELRACYVAPQAARIGVGRSIVSAIEKIAGESGLSSLWLDSSLTAEPFYARLGYGAVGRNVHVLASGLPMACVKMRKEL